MIHLQVPETTSHHFREGSLIFGIAQHGLADRKWLLPTSHQIQISDETIQSAGQQADAIFGRQDAFARWLGRVTSTDEVNVPYVSCEKSKQTPDQLQLRIPERRIGYSNLHLELPCPTVGAFGSITG